MPFVAYRVRKGVRQQYHRYLATLRADRPYERLNISKTSGLTNAQQAALQVLGASSADNAAPPLF